jgi:cytochrome c oxidase subunit I+III
VSAVQDAALARTWGSPATLRGFLGAVNHKAVGMRFIVTAFVFLLVGGVEALLMRTQLALPLLGVIGPQTYNELFTMHGTTMMFLFAVPMLEGLGSYFVPLMLGTRDMPFPRLNAFGYWAFLFGALFLHASFFVGAAPDGGWFAYVPLTRAEFSPPPGLDFWLLGVTFVEIAGVVFAIEMIVLVLKQRAPGMALSRMPLFAWTMLATAFTMLFAFPPLIVASILLELDRKVGTVFYDPTAGGDPILWQHLFWFFGHPDVYILFLPAAGIVSMIIPAFVRRRIAGYSFLVAATLITALLSFGVWVHHMYAVGLPLLTMSFFAAASLLFAVPNGIQYFAWTATIWRGATVVWRTPFLFVVGFLVIFLLGGVTGLMVAITPFDWQVHDSFFVVAHFHYVLIGGVVFPFLAGLHYWWPKLTGRMPSEVLGRWSFWLTFVGFNATFFVQHFLGLLGMPRRVYTFLPGLGWDWWNLISTLGAYMLGAGIALFGANLVWAWIRGAPAPPDPWGGTSLEWATSSPPPPYNFRTLPSVVSREPMWDDPPQVADAVAGWTEPLVEPVEGRREVLGTTELDAEPEEVFDLPQQSHWPLWTALAVAALLLGVLIDAYWLAVLGLLAAAGSTAAWLWPSSRRHGITTGSPRDRVRAGARPVGWWGSIVTLGALASGYGALVASYLYLRAANDEWPPEGVSRPALGVPLLLALLLLGSAGAVVLARMSAARGGSILLGGALSLAAVLGAAAVAVGAFEAAGLELGVSDHVYGSLFHVLLASAGALLVAGLCVLLAAAARAFGGHFDGGAHLTVAVASHLWLFGVGAALTLLALLYLVPYAW